MAANLVQIGGLFEVAIRLLLISDHCVVSGNAEYHILR
jgi:hypothetical protein